MWPPIRARSLADLVATVALVTGCAAPAPSPATRSAQTGDATPTPSPADLLPGAAAGPWRPAALSVTPAFYRPLETACRDGKPDLAGIPTAVVDARGEGLATLIVADDTDAFMCRVTVTAGGAVDVERIELPADPVGEEGIDILRYELERAAPGDPRTVMVRRVGERGRAVLASFDDESEVRAAIGGGWYAMWWPGSAEVATVAAVDNALVVVGDAAPSGPPAEP